MRTRSCAYAWMQRCPNGPQKADFTEAGSNYESPKLKAYPDTHLDTAKLLSQVPKLRHTSVIGALVKNILPVIRQKRTYRTYQIVSDLDQTAHIRHPFSQVRMMATPQSLGGYVGSARILVRAARNYRLHERWMPISDRPSGVDIAAGCTRGKAADDWESVVRS